MWYLELVQVKIELGLVVYKVQSTCTGCSSTVVQYTFAPGSLMLVHRVGSSDHSVLSLLSLCYRPYRLYVCSYDFGWVWQLAFCLSELQCGEFVISPLCLQQHRYDSKVCLQVGKFYQLPYGLVWSCSQSRHDIDCSLSGIEASYLHRNLQILDMYH